MLLLDALVPYNKIWRTGANNPTTISFSDYVKINNQLISAGEYHLYSVPTESTLDLVIYEKTDAWGSLPTFDKSKVIARTGTKYTLNGTSTTSITSYVANSTQRAEAVSGFDESFTLAQPSNFVELSSISFDLLYIVS